MASTQGSVVPPHLAGAPTDRPPRGGGARQLFEALAERGSAVLLAPQGLARHKVPLEWLQRMPPREEVAC